MHNWQLTEQSKINELVEIIHSFHSRGWSPATSTNYSFRSSYNRNHYVISQSGIDKSKFHGGHLMVIDQDGMSYYNSDLKSSAETALHTMLYQNPEVGAVLHTHSLHATYLSMQNINLTGDLTWEGLEILKGLEGNTTHEMTETLPVFANSQDIKSLAGPIADNLKLNPQVHGFVLQGHGLYTWGKDLASAKRHIETFEYLFSYKMLDRNLKR